MKRVIKKVGSKLPGVKGILVGKRNLEVDKGVLQLEKGQLEANIRDLKATLENPRDYLAHRYLRGSGIEIGAAQLPVRLPAEAHVKYVDVFTSDELRQAWPKDYMKLDIVEVDVVDDGEKLAKFKASSLDFIIANHFMEHCLDPIGTLINMYRKLRPGGILFFAIPDKRFTFDKDRPLTTYKHLLEEHNDKSKKFLWLHTEEFIRLGDKYTGDVRKRTQEVIDSGYRVHYHVWTTSEMYEFFNCTAADFSLNLEVQAVLKNQHEVIFILKKS